MKRLLLTAILTVGLFTSANATPITFSGTSGDLAASASFDMLGSNLLVTLTNTSTKDVLHPVDVLTAVFFTIDGNPTLTPLSALLGTSTVNQGSTVKSISGGVVGGEWAWAKTTQYGGNQGISSSGLGIFGSANFPGANLQGPPSGSVDGLQYGIVSAGDTVTTGNAEVLGSQLIKNAVTFTLSGLSAGFDPSKKITDVVFQYGTALNEGHFEGDDGGGKIIEIVPEPGTFILLGLGLAGLGFYRRNRKH